MVCDQHCCLDGKIVNLFHYLFKGHFSLQREAYSNACDCQNIPADRTRHCRIACNMLRLIHMYPANEYGRSESRPFVIYDYFMIVFIRRTPEEDDTASECIRTVAATCGCKILQLCEYDVNVYQYDENCEWTPQEYQFMQQRRQLIARLKYFCISLNSTCFKIKIITRNIMFL